MFTISITCVSFRDLLIKPRMLKNPRMEHPAALKTAAFENVVGCNQKLNESIFVKQNKVMQTPMMAK